MSKIDLAMVRQIHLDFHTPDFVTVGDQFDAAEFFKTLEQAAVNSIAVFATCHHGNSYFDTQTGRRHPGLGFDLLRAMCDEGDKHSIDLLAYFSFAVNEWLANRHPEWVAQQADGSPVNSQILEDGSELYWRWMCPNRGPLVEQFFIPHIREVLSAYPVQGIFIDMAGYLPGSCYCDGCKARADELGYDLDDPIQHKQFNDLTMQEFAKTIRGVLDEYDPEHRFEIGCFNQFGEAAKARGTISDFYIESLPIQRGWFFFPLMARYLRNLDMPVLGYTGRFLKNWGDFGTIKTAHQMKTEVSIHLAAGVGAGIGDHMHAGGRLEPEVYRVIGEAFRFVEKRQPWCSGYTPVREVALLAPTTIEGNSAAASKGSDASAARYDALQGAAKWLLESHLQWDVVTDEVPLDGFGTLVVSHGDVSQAMVERVEAFVEGGGTLVAIYDGLTADDPSVNPRWRKLLGVTEVTASEHPGSYYKVVDTQLRELGIPDMPHYAHGPSLVVQTGDDVTTLAEAWYPPCVRSREHFYGHFHGCATERGGMAVGVRPVGKGKVVLVAQQLLNIYLHTGYYRHRQLLEGLVTTQMDPARRVLRTNAPGMVEVTAGRKDGRIVLQLVPFISDRRHREAFESVSEPVSMTGIEIEWLGPDTIEKVYDPIDRGSIGWRRDKDGRVVITVPELREHKLIVME